VTKWARPKTRLIAARSIANLQTHPHAYITTSDLAVYWGVNRKQLYKQIDAGTLTAMRLGRILRISTVEAIRFEAIAKMSRVSSNHSIPPDSDRDEQAAFSTIANIQSFRVHSAR
jgi:excisionase family DNA binding protein